MTVSKCCGAEVELRKWLEEGGRNGIRSVKLLTCTNPACGKPCEAVEEEPLTPITEMTNAVSTPLSITPPASRLLTEEEKLIAKWGCNEHRWQTVGDKQAEDKLLQAQDAKTASLKDGEKLEILDALDGILGYAEEYHVAFDGETGRTRDWYLQALSHAQEVSKKYQPIKTSVEQAQEDMKNSGIKSA